MKNLSNFLLPIALVCLCLRAMSQEKVNYNSEKEPDELIPQAFAKKIHWGLSLPMYLTTFTGDNPPEKYFTKPSLGIQVHVEYFSIKNIGFGLGVGFQQRGAGITNPDKVKTLGDPDSTYIERIRFNHVEFPISILLRSNEIVKGMRLSGTASLVPLVNIKSNNIVHSVSDGNYLRTDQSDVYQKNDLLYQFSFGPDINTGHGIFRIHFVYSQGTKNVYDGLSAKGYNQGYGIKLSWLF